jgi:hypothetical protein
MGDEFSEEVEAEVATRAERKARLIRPSSTTCIVKTKKPQEWPRRNIIRCLNTNERAELLDSAHVERIKPQDLNNTAAHFFYYFVFSSERIPPRRKKKKKWITVTALTERPAEKQNQKTKLRKIT